MATTLVFLTTDVNITSEMLQKALSAETRETLNMLDLDGAPSPNDMACIMANGRAGNYIISCADTEYSKFCFVLRSVLLKICNKIIRADSEKRPFVCKVRGVKSKQIARAVAKKVIASEALKAGLQKGTVDVKAVLYAVLDFTPSVDLNNVSVQMHTLENSIAIFEKGIYSFL
jgi:glutamate N-acetyltransferase/amino-acid N-acetyltransferase